MTELAKQQRLGSITGDRPARDYDPEPGTGAEDNPKSVSVLITAYERVHYLEPTLRSVLAQSYENLDVAIFDNSETENVRNLVEEIGDPRVRYIRNHMNLGPLPNMRQAFSAASGDYFYVLSSDVMLHPQAIEKMVAFLQAHPTIPFVHARAARRQLDTNTDVEQPDPFVVHGLIENVTGPYSTKPVIDFCLSHKPLNAFSPYESLIVTDFFVFNDIGLPIPGWNASEYFYMLNFLLHTESAGYIDEALKYNIEHKERYTPSKKERVDYYTFERIKYMKDFVDQYWNYLAIRKFNLVRIRLSLAGKFLAFGCQPSSLSTESLVLFWEIVLKLLPALVSRVLLLPVSLSIQAGSALLRILRKTIPWRMRQT